MKVADLLGIFPDYQKVTVVSLDADDIEDKETYDGKDSISHRFDDMEVISCIASDRDSITVYCM